MKIELRILTGARGGRRERFEKPVIIIGRHPSCDLALDAERDLDVSSRHAEIRVAGDRAVLRDTRSTNGTFVNGVRIEGEWELRPGDVIGLGAEGPVVEVFLPDYVPSVRVPKFAGPQAPAPSAVPSAAGAKGSAASAPPPKPPAGKSSELHFLDVEPSGSQPPRAPGLVRPGLGGGRGLAVPPRKAAKRAPPPQRRGTVERIAEAVGAQTLVLRRALAAAGVLLVAGVAAAYWLGRSEARVNAEQLERLLKRNDSLSAAYEEDMDRLVGRVESLDSALAIAKRESDALRASLKRAPDAANPSAREVQELSARVRSAEARHEAILTASRTDYPSIAVMNGPAIALIAVERADGSSFTGSGFGATADGLVVTNRHLVRDASGAPPRRVAVIFADTRAWLPARVVRVSERDDLALLRIERRGQYPAVRAVTAARPAQVGAPIAIMGYPLGIDTPMEGAGTQITARATLGVGTVSKILDDVVQIDAYAGEGSSGSPVFDAVGAVVGVVYGGARESGGRIVYAVPGERLTALLALEGR